MAPLPVISIARAVFSVSVLVIFRQAPSAISTLDVVAPSCASLLMVSVPAVMLMSPVWLLVPRRISSPAPVLVSVLLPLSAESNAMRLLAATLTSVILALSVPVTMALLAASWMLAPLSSIAPKLKPSAAMLLVLLVV